MAYALTDGQVVVSKVNLPEIHLVDKAVSKLLSDNLSFKSNVKVLLALSNNGKILMIHTQEQASKWTVTDTGSKPSLPKLQTKIYNTSSGFNNPIELVGHTDIITSASFVNSSLCGGYDNGIFMLVTASNDTTVRLWNITIQKTSLTINCITMFTLFGGASSQNLRIVHPTNEAKNNGAYGQMVVGDSYGRVYWLQLLKKDL